MERLYTMKRLRSFLRLPLGLFTIKISMVKIRVVEKC